MTKEQIYDEKIFQLMAQIIDICKENKIAMVASFDITPPDDETPFLCSTALTTEEFNPPEQFTDCVKVIYHGYVAAPNFYAMTISSK